MVAGVCLAVQEQKGGPWSELIVLLPRKGSSFVGAAPDLSLDVFNMNDFESFVVGTARHPRPCLLLAEYGEVIADLFDELPNKRTIRLMIARAEAPAESPLTAMSLTIRSVPVGCVVARTFGVCL